MKYSTFSIPYSEIYYNNIILALKPLLVNYHSPQKLYILASLAYKLYSHKLIELVFWHICKLYTTPSLTSGYNINNTNLAMY